MVVLRNTVRAQRRRIESLSRALAGLPRNGGDTDTNPTTPDILPPQQFDEADAGVGVAGLITDKDSEFVAVTSSPPQSGTGGVEREQSAAHEESQAASIGHGEQEGADSSTEQPVSL